MGFPGRENAERPAHRSPLWRPKLTRETRSGNRASRTKRLLQLHNDSQPDRFLVKRDFARVWRLLLLLFSFLSIFEVPVNAQGDVSCRCTAERLHTSVRQLMLIATGALLNPHHQRVAFSSRHTAVQALPRPLSRVITSHFTPRPLFSNLRHGMSGAFP